MTITQRINVLNESGLINIIKQTENGKKYLPNLYDETLENPFPVFTARDYDWSSKEYKAMLAFDLHFGCKSPNKQVAKQQLQRFIELTSKL